MFGEIDSLVNLVSRIGRFGCRSHIHTTVSRFKRLIKEHDFKLAQVSSLLPGHFNHSTSDFRSDESIEEILTDDLLDWAAKQFNVRKEWLQGADETIYAPTLYGYKNIDGLFKTMSEQGLLNGYTTMNVFTSGQLTQNSNAKLWVALEVPFISKKGVSPIF